MIESRIVSAQPEKKTKSNPVKKNNNRSNRSERTKQKIDRYARTQELFKRNPSRLAQLAVEGNLGELSKEREKFDPP